MGSWKALRGGWDHDVPVAQRRAKLAMVALLVIAASHVFTAVVGLWQVQLLGDLDGPHASLETLKLVGTLLQVAGAAELGLVIVTGVLFLRWLAWTVTTARAMIGTPHLGWTASKAVWGFFIPF